MTPFFFFFTSGGGSVTQTVTVQAQASLTGVSLRLRSRSTGAVVDTEVAAETASGSSVYTADFTDVPAGTYFVQLIRDSDGAILRYSDATLTLTTATFPVSGSGGVAELNTATQTQIDNIEQTVEGLSSGSGTGARTVTITVNDGATVLQNATVRMTEGVSTFTALTNVSGAAVFNLDDATYAVSITKPGYSYAGTSLIVNGTETATYSMTAISVTPPDDPALSAVTIHLRDQYGDDLGGQPVEITFVKWDATATETPPVLSIPPVQTTDSGGLVRVNLYRLAVYKIIYGEARDARRWDGTIPDAGSYEVEL